MGAAAGWQRHVWGKKETTYGTAVVCDIWFPVETYDVMAHSVAYQAAMHVGVRQRRAPVQFTQTNVQGTMAGDLCGLVVSSKSLMQHLIEWATNGPASLDLDSWTLNHYDPNDQKVHAGCRINSMTISGQQGGPIKYSLNIIAQSESTVSVPSLVATRKHGKACLFQDATFALGGSAMLLRSFSLTINNNLIPEFNNGQNIAVCAAGVRTVDWQFQFRKEAGTKDALRRALSTTNVTGQLVIKGDHEGTGSDTYSVATFDIDVMNHMDTNEATNGLNELLGQDSNYVIIKPNTTDNELDVTFSTV